MLNWSATKYKFTLGLGALGIGALLSILWKPIFSPSMVVPIAILPFVLFLSVDPGEMPDTLVRSCQIFGSAWYVVWVVAVAIGLALEPNLPPDWILLISLCLPGLFPTIWVLSQAIWGRRRQFEPDPQGDASGLVDPPRKESS